MDRAEWLSKRRESLGASEVAAVCGLDPFKSAWDIWAVKKGYRQETESDAGEMGNRIEPVLLQWYADKTGRALRQVGTVYHPTWRWASCTPDAIAGQLDVQAKVVGARMMHRWDDGPPHYVHAQVGWEMWVAELPAAEVVALLGGTDPQIFQVARNEELISYLVEICSRWWRDHVIGDAPPEVDGSESARMALQGRFPSATAGMAEAVPEFIEMAREYERLGDELGGLKEKRESIGNAMRLAIGNRAGLFWPGGRVSWKHTSAGQRPLRVYIKE